MNIINDLDLEQIKLSNAEMLILRFIETKTNQFVNMTITELSKTLFVSIGTITNFVKKVEFTNYKDLKKHAIKILKNTDKKNLFNTNQEIENVNLFYVHSIEKTINLLDIDATDQVVKKIIAANKIITIGMGSSLIPATEMANALNSLNINAIAANSIHNIAAWADESKKNKYLIIIFSKSMSSHELLFLYEMLKKHNIGIVLITSNKLFKKQKNVDVLLFDTLEQDKRLFSLSSKVAELFVSDILMMKIHSILYKTKGEFYNEFQTRWRTKK